jgi:hypothetical protein
MINFITAANGKRDDPVKPEHPIKNQGAAIFPKACFEGFLPSKQQKSRDRYCLTVARIRLLLSLAIQQGSRRIVSQ